ncbi:MAG: hypothetical protein WBB48_00235 [Thermodesulfobacteriota bacterium]
MNLSRKFLILIIFSIMFTTLLNYEAHSEESSDVKKELKELRQMMEQMEQKIENLEERNRVLEQQANDQQEPAKEETIVVEEETDLTVIEEPAQESQTFFGKALNAFNPQISVIGTFAAAYYSQDEPFVFAENDPENTGVNVQEIEVGFQGVVDSFFRYDMFLSFSTEGVELEEAYGTTLFSLPLNSQFRIGRARAKFGRINQLHRHAQDFVTLALPAAQFLGEHLNPTSIEANFLVPVPWYLELSASGGSPDVETPTFARDEDANDLGRLLYIFHVSNFFELSEALGVSLGGSFATGSNGTAAGERSNLYGIDLYAKYRPLKNNPYQEITFQSEFMYLDAQTPEETLENWGWYAQSVYRFAKRWNAGFRFGIIDTNTPVTEVEEDGVIEPTNLFASIRNEEGDEEEAMLGLLGRTYRISPMLTFNPSEFSQIRLQYDYLNQDFAENQHAIFLQFQYAIGAHGAHPF